MVRTRLLYTLFCLPVFLAGQGQSVKASFNQMKDHPAFSGTSIFCYIGSTNGAAIFGYREDQRGVPASSIKPLTAGWLWLEKGSDYRWQTEIRFKGKLDPQGTLEGDVWIVPSGDPTLASEHSNGKGLGPLLANIHRALYDCGIRCVNGSLYLFTGGLEGPAVPGAWSREDAGNYYGGGYWPLNIMDNTYRLCFTGRKQTGDRPQIITIEPPIEDLTLRNNVRIGPPGSGDQAYIFGGPEAFEKVIYGTIPPGNGPFCIKGAIPDPPSFFLDTLVSFCEKKGLQIGLASQVEYLDTARTKIAWAYKSESLQQILPVTLEKSINLYSDAFMMALADGETKAIHREASGLAGRIASVSPGPAVLLNDGSGMSPANGITARQMAANLVYFYHHMKEWSTFAGAFPRDAKVPSIHWKSGSMSGIQTYCGYILRDEREPLVFSIMVNQIAPGDRAQVRERMQTFIRSLTGP